MDRLFPRFVGVFIAAFLGYFLFLRGTEIWTNYWLKTDGQRGAAIITREYWGPNKVVYEYEVDQTKYVGVSRRNRQEPEYRNVKPGDKSVVYYSTSHPWLSLLYKPRGVVVGLPVIILVVILELFAIITIINPKSMWAFDVEKLGKQ